jgi:spore coat protein JB
MNRDSLLAQLTALDFMAVELALYLDTHPCEVKVIEKYNSVIREADMIRTEFERLYGPLCSYRSASNVAQWNWIDNPWPWECAANFEIQGKERQ